MSGKRLPLPSAEQIAALPPDGGPEFNRLVFESSPYLLQHCRNPVDWYPWGDEAFARAKAEGKPVFLSIGYSTCYWCHVMERESFENDAVAEVLNKYYICIKVDREERPDVDALYVTATQMMLGHAGWPDNVWLNEKREPWFASTYIPRDDGEDGIGFKTLLVRLADKYKSGKSEIDDMASKMTAEMDKYNKPAKLAEPSLDRSLMSKPLRALSFAFDSVNGGVGQEPKFPPHGALALWSYEYRQSKEPKILEKIDKTLGNMAKGGIHDHVGGGFHRYSTDRQWILPHFEKMLYDNAQLGRAYVDGWLLTDNPEYGEIARGTYDWVLREMRDPKGGFFSAIDAETDGEEGVYYTFTPDEVTSVLGTEEGRWFAQTFHFEPQGNYHDERTGQQTGKNVLYRLSLEDLAAESNTSADEVGERLAEDCSLVLEYRQRRDPPHIDDKVICSWNALMIGSLAYGARHLNEPRYAKAAKEAAEFVLSEMVTDGRLAHSWRGGRIGGAAFLDDYALLAQAMLELYQTTGEQRWLEEARRLMGDLKAHYEDAEGGGFFYTANDRETLINRAKSGTDDVIPSGNGISAQVFAQLSAIGGGEAEAAEARRIIQTFAGQMNEAPLSTESLYVALAMLADKAVSPGDPGGSLTADAAGAGAGKAAAHSLQQPVQVDLYADSLSARPGGSVEFSLAISLDQGFHVNSHSPLQDFLLPCSVSLEAEPSITLGEVEYPLGSEFMPPQAAEPQSVYFDGTELKGSLKLSPEIDSGVHKVTLLVNLQPCNERECLLAQTHRLEFEVEVSSKQGHTGSHGGGSGQAARGSGAGADPAALPLAICSASVAFSLLSAYIFRKRKRKAA